MNPFILASLIVTIPAQAATVSGTWTPVKIPGNPVSISRPSNARGATRVIGYVAKTENRFEISAFDTVAGVATSLAHEPAPPHGDSDWDEWAPLAPPQISPDGDTAYFVSTASDLVSPSPAAGWNVYAQDLRTHQTRLLSGFPTAPQSHSYIPHLELNADGSCLLFLSGAKAGPVMALRTSDQTYLNLAMTPAHVASQAAADHGSATQNCETVAFISPARDILPGNFSGLDQLFLVAGSELPTLGVSAIGGAFPYEGVNQGMLTLDGSTLAYQSDSGDLPQAAGQSDGVARVYVTDRKTGATDTVFTSSTWGDIPSLLDFSISGQSIVGLACVDQDKSCTMGLYTHEGKGWANQTFQIPAGAGSPIAAKFSNDGQAMSMAFRQKHTVSVYLFTPASPIR